MCSDEVHNFLQKEIKKKLKNNSLFSKEKRKKGEPNNDVVRWRAFNSYVMFNKKQKYGIPILLFWSCLLLKYKEPSLIKVKLNFFLIYIYLSQYMMQNWYGNSKRLTWFTRLDASWLLRKELLFIPVTISRSIIPKLYTSNFSEYIPCMAYSGAMYPLFRVNQDPVILIKYLLNLLFLNQKKRKLMPY